MILCNFKSNISLFGLKLIWSLELMIFMIVMSLSYILPHAKRNHISAVLGSLKYDENIFPMVQHSFTKLLQRLLHSDI